MRLRIEKDLKYCLEIGWAFLLMGLIFMQGIATFKLTPFHFNIPFCSSVSEWQHPKRAVCGRWLKRTNIPDGILNYLLSSTDDCSSPLWGCKDDSIRSNWNKYVRRKK